MHLSPLAEKETQFICTNAGLFGTAAGDIYQVKCFKAREGASGMVALHLTP